MTKQRDPETNQRSLIFQVCCSATAHHWKLSVVRYCSQNWLQVDYPEIEDGLQPRHRFMSAYEQKIEAADGGYQYLVILPAMSVVAYLLLGFLRTSNWLHAPCAHI